jgi:dTDP-4-dehydrorhamnose 3,5-epimerase
MNGTATILPEVYLLEPKVFKDQRGFFLESFNQQKFSTASGTDLTFVQDNPVGGFCEGCITKLSSLRAN